MAKTIKKTPKIGDIDPTVVSEIFTRRVAVLAMGGMSARKIADDMGLAHTAIEAIQKREDYKKHIKHVGEQELGVAVLRMKWELSGMSSTAVKVYQKVMQDYLDGKTGARDAVTVAQSITRAIGADKDEGKVQDTQLTIVLPGGKDVITFDAQTGDETDG